MPQIDITQYPDTVALFDTDAEHRATVFLDRYSLKDADGNPTERDPQDMWARVANSIGKDPDQRGKFYELLKDFKFVPGGRILAGAGTESEVTYYNCYVIPVETKIRRHINQNIKTDLFRLVVADADPGSDSREAIFDTIGLMVDIMSRGGGVGINWSVLRPKGTHLKRVNGTTSGPVSWMDVASRAVGVVEQGGSRRGAAMFMLDDWHPDVEEFINAKRDLSLITNANVSVAVSDEFMAAVRSDGDWDLRFPDTTDPRYNTDWDGNLLGWEASGGRVQVSRTVRARDLWRSLAESAWASGEPGVVFLGRYNELSTGSSVERIISVNPCGEQGLGAYSVCNLGAMNLAAFVDDYTGKMAFDWPSFINRVADAVEFLDRVIDVTHYFIPENEAIQKRLRRIGLGVMGLADALILLDLRYGSPEAIEFTERVFSHMKKMALTKSASLAEEYGPAPAWDDTMLYSPYIGPMEDSLSGAWDHVERHGLRNLFLLTQAPTGTTSILAGVNSGIEPLFDFTYTRKDRTGTHKVLAPVLEQLKYDFTWTADYLVRANDVSVEEHIAMQAAAQRYIDSSVSKTINGPTEQTVEDVEKAYTLAYDSGLKGVAYFRDGSGRDQVLYHEEPKVETNIEPWEEIAKAALADLHEIAPYAIETVRPEVLHGTTHKVYTKSGSAYVTINRTDEGRPIELFINIGNSGDDTMALGEALGRLGSLALRHGASLGGVANQLEGIGGRTKIAFQKSIPHAIGEALTIENQNNHHIDPGIEAFENEGGYVSMKSPAVGLSTLMIPLEDIETEVARVTDPCPVCGEQTAKVEGCKTCYSCGWSAC